MISQERYGNLIYNPSTIGRNVLEHLVGGGFTLPLYPPPYGPPSGSMAKNIGKHTCLNQNMRFAHTGGGSPWRPSVITTHLDAFKPTVRRNCKILCKIIVFYRRPHLFKHTVRDSVGFKPNSVGQVAIKLDRAGLFGIRPILPGCWFVCTV